jgi:hypothetical protein
MLKWFLTIKLIFTTFNYLDNFNYFCTFYETL